MRWIIERKPLLQLCATCGKFPEVEPRRPASIATQYLHEDVAGGVTQLSQLRGKLSRLLQVGSSPMVGKLAPQGEQKHPLSLQRRRELPRPRVYLGQLRRAPAPVCNQRLTEGDL